MATTQAALRQALSKEIDDNWSGTTTSTGTSTTLIDSALTSKANDWVSDGTGDRVVTTVRITSGNNDGEEREVTSLDNSTGTVTVDRAFSNAVASSVTYEINRQFTAQEKEDAIDHACYMAFPDLYTKVIDETITFGNWLRNGCFDTWTSSANPDEWAVDTITAAEETTVENTHRGTSSCKLTRAGSDGFLYTDETLVRDLWDLEEESPTFYAWVKADVASQVRLAILDGTTTTYSSYHSGDSAWRELDVSATIAQYATGVEFRVCVESDNTAVYVDDARVVSVGGKYAYDISDLGLHMNQPHQVRRIIDDEKPYYSYELLRCWEGPTVDGRIRFRKALPDEAKLQIVGMGYLTPPTSSTSCSVDEPQVKVITALAAVYLFDLMIGRCADSDVDRYASLRSLWEQKAAMRKKLFRMPPPEGTVLY